MPFANPPESVPSLLEKAPTPKYILEVVSLLEEEIRFEGYLRTFTGGELRTMKYLETFKPEYYKHLNILSNDERFAVEHFYGLLGKPKLNLPGIAELFRSPGVSDVQTRALIFDALKKLDHATQGT